jgi:hypothetical protein
MKLMFGDPESIAQRDRTMRARRYGAWGVKKIAYMHQVYGVTPGERCRDCKLLVSYHANSSPVNKCLKYGDSRSVATDWRQKWDACGLFEKRTEEPP